MKNKLKKKPLVLYIVIAWLVTTAFVVYFYLPIIFSNLNYYFGKKDQQTEENKNDSKAGDNSNQKSAEKKIVMPKIGIDAPIVEPATLSDSDILKALESGVVHYSNTSKPGEQGNVFLTGHSSNYRWAKGNYNYVFSLLNKLINDDEIIVYYDGVKYVYKVFEVVVVSPKDVSVLNQTEDSIVSVMTCDPPGTAWKRRVVKAKQIEPDSSKNRISETKAQEIIQKLIGN